MGQAWILLERRQRWVGGEPRTQVRELGRSDVGPFEPSLISNNDSKHNKQRPNPTSSLLPEPISPMATHPRWFKVVLLRRAATRIARPLPLRSFPPRLKN